MNACPGRMLAAFVLLLIGQSAISGAGAQTIQRLQVGLAPFALNYTGDLTNEDENFHRVYPGFNVSVQFESPRLVSPQLNFGFGKFTAQDRELEPVEGILPNTFVETNYFYFDATLRVRFLRRRKFRPHIGPGLGLLNFTPRGPNGNELADDLQSRNVDESYSTTSFFLPLMVGFTWRLNDFVAIGMDYKYFLLTTDYVDNIGELGQRSGNDRLSSLNIGLYLTPAARLRKGTWR